MCLCVCVCVCVCVVCAVDVAEGLYVRLNGLTWLTAAGDELKSARYMPARNSTFELGAAEVGAYGWPDITCACYGRVQRFFFIRQPALELAKLLAVVSLFSSVSIDDLTGLPIVDTTMASDRVILASHLNWRVIMPVAGASPQLVKRHADLTRAVDRCRKQVGTRKTLVGRQTVQTELDAAELQLAEVNRDIHSLQTTRRLVLGARVNDQESVVPPA